MGYEIDNELVRQKDTILQSINIGDFERAIDRLEFAKELWFKCGYDYKYREIVLRLIEEVRFKFNTADHWKTKDKWNKLLLELYKLREDCQLR